MTFRQDTDRERVHGSRSSACLIRNVKGKILTTAERTLRKKYKGQDAGYRNLKRFGREGIRFFGTRKRAHIVSYRFGIFSRFWKKTADLWGFDDMHPKRSRCLAVILFSGRATVLFVPKGPVDSEAVIFHRPTDLFDFFRRSERSGKNACWNDEEERRWK